MQKLVTDKHMKQISHDGEKDKEKEDDKDEDEIMEMVKTKLV